MEPYSSASITSTSDIRAMAASYRATTPRRMTATSPEPEPKTPAGRKAPHCTKCGQLRAGHPRRGCPFTDPPASSTLSKTKSVKDELDPDVSISRALSPTGSRLEEDKGASFRRSRSPSTLKQRIKVEECTASQERKLEYHLTLTRLGKASSPQRKGSDTEEEDSSDVETSGDDMLTEVDQPRCDVTKRTIKHESAAPTSMASLDRATFLAQLSSEAAAAPVTVYVLPHTKISQASADARAKGLCAVAVPFGPTSQHTLSSKDRSSLRQLVVGKDISVVLKVGQALRGEIDSKDVPSRGFGTVATGAAVIGAVATLLGLAYL